MIAFILFCSSFIQLLIYPTLVFVNSDPVIENEDPFIVGFSEDILISTNDGDYVHHVEPTLAIDSDGKIFAGWKNADGHNTRGVRVSFSRSDDNGKTWTTPYNMPMFEGIFTGQSDPWFALYQDIIYYAYLEYSRAITSDLSQITVAKSDDYGYSWSTVSATNGDDFADKETMTIDSLGNIYVAYDDILTNGTVIVRITRSINEGESFQERGIIADSRIHPIDHVGPYVTTNSENDVFVTWTWITTDYWGDIYITNSTDQGATFETRLDINPTSENGTFTIDLAGRPKEVTLPVIKFDSNDRLYILWSELIDPDGSWGIFLRYSDDNGLTWSSRYTINQIVNGNQWQPDMDIDSQGRLHISYYDQQGNSYGPYYRIAYFSSYSSTELIITDAIPIASDNTSTVYTRPGDYFTIRVDSDDIPHVVWTDGRNEEMDIFYSHGITAGLSSLQKGLAIGIPISVIVIGVSLSIVIITKERKYKNKRKSG